MTGSDGSSWNRAKASTPTTFPALVSTIGWKVIANRSGWSKTAWIRSWFSMSETASGRRTLTKNRFAESWSLPEIGAAAPLYGPPR
jgi:hypothetical protein